MRRFSVILFISISFFACKKYEPTAQEYPFELRLTDAAGPYDSVKVEITSIEFYDDQGACEWRNLSFRPAVYELTHLANGYDTFLAKGVSTTGRISHLRIHFGENNLIGFKGKVLPLRLSPYFQKGLTLKLDKILPPGRKFTLTLDFDVARSVYTPGNDQFVLRPVIRTFTSKSANIKGVVYPKAIRPAIYAISGRDTFSALADTSGYFMIRGINYEGDCKLIIHSDAMPDKIIPYVNLNFGKTTDLKTISLP